jgi:WD40 repeat protein
LDFPTNGVQPTTVMGEGESSTGFGNYIAVGTMDPTIEIWDMDMLDPIYPNAMLGPAPGSLTDPVPKAKGTGKKKKKLLQTNADHHVSSVTSLSWSGFHRNLLLSSSADSTVKLWDLSRPNPQAAIKSWDNIHPNEKVLAVEWNKHKGGENKTVVLSAGERTVKVWDTRASEEALGTGKLGSDVEAIKWDPWTGMDFFVSMLTCFRNLAQILIVYYIRSGLARERSDSRLRCSNPLLPSQSKIRSRPSAKIHHFSSRWSRFCSRC